MAALGTHVSHADEHAQLASTLVRSIITYCCLSCLPQRLHEAPSRVSGDTSQAARVLWLPAAIAVLRPRTTMIHDLSTVGEGQLEAGTYGHP